MLKKRNKIQHLPDCSSQTLIIVECVLLLLRFQRHRFRRASHVEPQRMLSLQSRQSLSSPDRDPIIARNYNLRKIRAAHPDDPKNSVDASVRAQIDVGRVIPQAGVTYTHNFNKELSLTAGAQVQRGPRGGISPFWLSKRERKTKFS